MSYLVRVRRAAELDIEEAQLWYEAQREGLGAEFREEVSKVLNRLADTPFIYEAIHRDVRRVVLCRFPYLVWYRVVGNIATVLACTDGRQDPIRTQTQIQ